MTPFLTGTHTLTGACHCGALRLTFETETPPAALPLRICTCSFCARQGARYTADKAGRVAVAARGDALHRYRFATQTAEILSCGTCGCYIAAVTTVDGALFAAINVNLLDDRSPFDRAPGVTNFAHQTAEERGIRRQASWTPATLDVAAAAR
jgi:hypothetical protein